MSYRLTDPAPVLFNLLGTARAANGSLTFYEKGTTTPTDTWSDQGLTTPNANPVPLDASGRAETEIWMDGEYTVVAKASDGSTIWTRVVAPEIAPGLAIPSLTGKTSWFLSNNGTDLVWQDILALLLPDPTGSAGYMVVVNADGTGYLLQPVPEPEDPAINIEATSNSIGETGNTSHRFEQTGSGSAEASNTHTTQAAIVFDEAFTTTPIVIPVPSVASVASGGYLVTVSVISKSTTGFTVKFDTNDSEGSSANIITPITFDWIAIGRKTIS